MNNYFDGIGTIGFTCDNCGRQLQGCTWVNGMKLCAKCYQETFGNNTSQFVDLLNKEMYELKIATLEKQLADSEAQNKRVLEKLELLVRSNQELEKELAEKEKATIEKVFDVINKKYNWLGWIEDVEFDEFKENVLAELAKEK